MSRQPEIGTTVSWRAYGHSDQNPPLRDREEVVVTVLGGQRGPFPVVRVRENRGPVASTGIGTEGMYTGYWLYEGEVIGFRSEAEVYSRASGCSDQFGRHIDRLISGD